MRKFLLTAFSVAVFNFYVSAQVADTAFASVLYSFSHVIDTTQPESPIIQNMVLYLGKSMSNYTSYDRIKMMQDAKNRQTAVGGSSNIVTANGSVLSAITATGPNAGLAAQIAVSNSYYKNIEAAKMSFTIFTDGKLFAVEENTPTIDWTITQETKEIQGLQCQKATAKFKGRMYEAWFCSQLPYSNGPWKLGGLPGLILEASDSKKEVVFKFVSFENASGSLTAIEIPASALKTSPKEYQQYQEALKRDRQANIGSTSGGYMSAVSISVSGRPMADGTGKPVKPKQMNNPIEKDN